LKSQPVVRGRIDGAGGRGISLNLKLKIIFKIVDATPFDPSDFITEGDPSLRLKNASAQDDRPGASAGKSRFLHSASLSLRESEAPVGMTSLSKGYAVIKG